MQRKTVIFVADSLDNAHKFQQVLSGLDVDVAAGSSLQFRKLLAQHPNCDLVVYEARGDALSGVAQAEQLLVEDGSASMLVIVGEDQLGEFRLPVQVKADFVVHGASAGDVYKRQVLEGPEQRPRVRRGMRASLRGIWRGRDQARSWRMGQSGIPCRTVLQATPFRRTCRFRTGSGVACGFWRCVRRRYGTLWPCRPTPNNFSIAFSIRFY